MRTKLRAAIAALPMMIAVCGLATAQHRAKYQRGVFRRDHRFPVVMPGVDPVLHRNARGVPAPHCTKVNRSARLSVRLGWSKLYCTALG
jgi:hypothetical protein